MIEDQRACQRGSVCVIEDDQWSVCGSSQVSACVCVGEGQHACDWVSVHVSLHISGIQLDITATYEFRGEYS